MRPRQRKSCNTVVKRSCIPSFGGVAGSAIRHRERWAGCRMGGIFGLLPSRQVAAGISAIRRRDLEIVIVVDVAGRAGNFGVPVRQQKSG
jgi:hypothetical protein